MGEGGWMLKAGGEIESVDSLRTSIQSGLLGARISEKFHTSFGVRSLLWRT